MTANPYAWPPLQPPQEAPERPVERLDGVAEGQDTRATRSGPREPVGFLTRSGRLEHNTGRYQPTPGDRPLYEADAVHEALEIGYARGWRDGHRKGRREVLEQWVTFGGGPPGLLVEMEELG